ncbi:MAG: phage terminase large subunit [Candidatus Margulisiibacteriota bacterium]
MKLTAKQKEAQKILANTSDRILYFMLFGGSRSGKTFLFTRNVCVRAIKAPRSRHSINRFRFNACKQSIALETFPTVMAKCFPNIKYKIDKTDWYASFENGSEIWFNGLDDKERVEKALGKEYATIYNNECSQIPLASRNVMRTRLAQKVEDIDGNLLRLREYNDCNPPNKLHWSYLEFIRKLNAETKQNLPNPQDYFSFQMNPADNLENIAPNYIEMLESQGARIQRRFLYGEFSEANPNALFNDTDIDKWRVLDGSLPDFVRVVVAVDPSGSGDVDNADNDAIGIVVAALGTDGNGYLLEDCTVKCAPKTWGMVAASAFDRHNADVIVGEMNYGGEMVRHVIQTARPRTPFKPVTASRGKCVRAEPISALYESGKIRHVGFFNELEDELCAFSTVGYTGDDSPNRADAAIWAFTELFPGMTAREEQPIIVPQLRFNHWMAR